MFNSSPHQDSLFALESAMSASDWERIEAAEAAASTYITTDRDRLLRARLSALLRNVLVRRDRTGTRGQNNRSKGRALLIVGRSGAGKTRTIQKAVMEYKALKPLDDEFPQRPLISINAPEIASPRSLYLRLLGATGYPLIHAPSTEVVLERFKAQARRLGTLVIHIDDAANMLTGLDAFRQRRAAEKMATSLRALMEDDNPFSLIISGLDISLDLMRCDEAFARRAEPMIFAALKENEAASLARVIHDRADKAGLKFKPSKNLIERLSHAANHQLGLALEISWQAVARAKERASEALGGEPILDVCDFADVYHRRTACRFGFNVFEAADWRQIDTSETIPKLLSETKFQPRRVRKAKA